VSKNPFSLISDLSRRLEESLGALGFLFEFAGTCMIVASAVSVASVLAYASAAF